ncbi:MAG TPA: enoyl-CoA hydratase/isomerase family protein [Haliangiales bacterium]|nr:enoyl-CoA hydratase/isomerase family protein [Haliangiales bacterium]
MSSLVKMDALEGGVTVLELTNPPANAYSYEMFRELDEHILAARMDERVHAIVLRGAGDKFFCAGADIAMLQRAAPDFKYYFCLHANETLLRLQHTPKLVVAALNGHCVGGGLEVALAADIRVAKRGPLKIGFPEVALGVLPGTGGTQRLARLVGQARAFELMARGATLSVDEALAAGIVSHVFDEADFWPRVLELARSFCPPAKAARAVGRIKRAVVTGWDVPLESGLALERELQQQLFLSEDAREGLAAFGEKRPPRFTGR